MDASTLSGNPLDEGLDLPEPIQAGTPAPAASTSTATSSNEPDNLPTPVPAADHLTIADHVIDIGKGLIRGAEGAVRGIRQTARATADATGLSDIVGDSATNAQPLTYGSEAPEGLAGKVAADVAQVALGYAVGGVATKALKLTGVAGAMAQSAVGTPLVADADRERLSNLLEQYPFLKPAASLLAQNPNDPVLLSKAKAGLEDVLTTGAAASVFRGLRLAFLKATGKGSPADIAAAEKEVVAANGTEKGTENITPTVKPPVTVNTLDGTPAYTLTPAQQAKYEAAMRSTVLKDATGTLEALPDGPVLGSPNPSHLDSPDNILHASAELGKVLQPSLAKSIPGYRSIDETKNLAAILGQDEGQLVANLKMAAKGMENIDVTATGARQLIQGKTAEAFALARKATISGDPEAIAAWRKSYMDMAQVQIPLAQITTSLGRGLRSYGETVGPMLKAMSQDVNDPAVAEKLMRLMAATDGDVGQMASILKLQQMSLGQKLIGAHNEYWTGLGLLSRATTQIVNVGSTALNTLMSPAAMATGGVVRGLAGKGWQEAREGVAIYNGLKTSFVDSMKMAWSALKTDKQSALSGGSTSEMHDKYISALAWNMNPDAFMGKFVDLAGNITRASFRGLSAGDEFFKQLNYRARVAAQASRQAVDLVAQGTLQQDEVAGYVADALQKAIDSNGAATNQGAIQYAEKTTFVNDLKGATWLDAPSIGSAVSQMASNPLLRGTILPFVKTPVNVTRALFDYTPIVGQFRKQFLADMQAGGEAQAMAIGKLTLGSGMYAGAAMLAIDGKITGGMPPKGVIMPTGYQPYSVVFTREDGSKRYVSYSRLQPFGDILGLTADFTKLTGLIDEEQRNGVAASMAMSLSNALVNKSYLRSLTEVLSILGDDNEKKAERWLDNHIASYVPGLIAQFNPDTSVREVRGMLDAIMARTPGLSQALPARRDYFGQVRDTRVGLPWSVVNPFAISDTKADPVMSELSRLSTSNGEVKFSEPDAKVFVGGKNVDLHDITNDAGRTAYDRLGELVGTVRPLSHSGKAFREALDSAMKAPRYELKKGADATLDGTPQFPGYRASTIKSIEADYRQAALDQTKQEYAKELGIQSPLKDRVQTEIARKKTRAGLYDQLIKLGK